MTQVNGPSGPQGVNYVQQAEVINNNNYLMRVPDSHYQDRVTFTANREVFTPQQVFNLMGEAFVMGYQQGNIMRNNGDYRGGSYYGGPTQSEQLEQTFAYADMLLASMYAQSNDPLADLRGTGTMVSSAIRDAMAPMPNQAQPQATNANQQQQLLDQLVAYRQQLQAEMQRVDQLIEKLSQGQPIDNNAATDGATGTPGTNAAQPQQQVDMDKVNMAAERIHYATEKQWGTDEDGIRNALTSLNPQERAALELVYAEKYGNGNTEHLRDVLRGELSGDDESEIIGYLDSAAHLNPYTAAIALREAVEGMGTEDETIETIFKNASPEQLAAIEKAYAELYDGASLKDDIADDYGAWDTLGSVGTGAAAGAATAAGATAIFNAIPVVGTIAYGVSCTVGAIVGGIMGLFSDDSSDKKTAYLSKLATANSGS
ncbi:MAG: hypothetical protein AB1782_09635 [Cyanobacteriota bacterium]